MLQFETAPSDSIFMMCGGADAHPPLRVQIGTFNYNLRGDPQGNTPKLSDWLVPTLSETDAGHATGHGPVPRSQNAAREAPDIYAVGFQELMPLHIGFCGSGKSAPFIPLARSAQEILDDTDTEIRRAIRPHAALVSNGGLYPEGGGPETYTLLARSHMVGVSLFVYGRDRSGVAERVKEIRANVVGTGLLNLLGNKGAVGIRLVLSTPSRTREEESAQDQVLTFVCAHLAAHDHNVARRQQDYASIVSRLAFSPDTVLPIPVDNPAVGSALKPADVKQPKKQYANQTSAPKERSAQALDSDTYSMYNCSHVFFFGDLNYRIGVNTRPHPKSDLPSTFTLTSAQVRDGVQNEKWSLLANYDQLSIERLSGRALQGLTELPLDWARFAPSYKYTVFEAPPMPPGTRPYKPTLQQTRQLSHKRTPGWCDRVLWRSWADGPDPSPLSGPGATRVELYRSVMGFTHSDHKPVTAILALPPVPAGQPAQIAFPSPYHLDPRWRTKQRLGIVLDRTVGYLWSLLLSAGSGSLIGGLVECVAVLVFSLWWLQTGGQAGNGVVYWLRNVLS